MTFIFDSIHVAAALNNVYTIHIVHLISLRLYGYYRIVLVLWTCSTSEYRKNNTFDTILC